MTRWDITGPQVNRHLLSGGLTGTDVVLDHMTLPAELHLPHAPPSGYRHGQRPATGDGPIRWNPSIFHRGMAGAAPVHPTGARHQISNATDTNIAVLHRFLGLSAATDVGYEAHRTTLAVKGGAKGGPDTTPRQLISRDKGAQR